MTNVRKTLLAIDPGEVSGFALFDINSRELIKAFIAKLLPKRKAILDRREARIVYIKEAHEIIQAVKPDVVVVEAGFVGKNPASSLLLEGRRWVWEHAAILAGCEIGERVQPREWQSAIGCWKGSDVKAIARSHVRLKYSGIIKFPAAGIDKKLKKYQDLCDAICIGEVATWGYMVKVRELN